MQIRTLGDLLKITESELLAYKNFGETSLIEIKQMLAAKGLRLGQGLEGAGYARVRNEIYEKLKEQVGAEVLEKSVASLEFSVRCRKALQMLVDGNAGEDVKNILEMEMDMLEHHGNASAKLLESAGGYAPTVGILGAVLGLIHVMQNLSDPSKLGTGIAVAFVATIYGVGIANLLFLPLGGRLKKIVGGDTEDRAMVVAGINGIVAGANARQIGEILAPFTHHAGEHEGTTDKEQAA